jgi:uncharacterized protein YfaS (alpha-2-macroglobulin family)
MAVYTFAPGSVVALNALLTQQSNGAAIDPTTIVLQVIDPSGTQTQFTYPGQVTRNSAGNYSFNYSTTLLFGDYSWRWVATGTGQGASEGIFNVAPSRFSGA